MSDEDDLRGQIRRAREDHSKSRRAAAEQNADDADTAEILRSALQKVEEATEKLRVRGRRRGRGRDGD